jgi:S-adenosylmethionine uptake transporter
MRLPHPIILVCLAVLCGCTLDATMKGVTLGGTGVITATAWRYILASVIMVSLFVAARRPMPGAKGHPFPHLTLHRAGPVFGYLLLRADPDHAR